MRFYVQGLPFIYRDGMTLIVYFSSLNGFSVYFQVGFVSLTLTAFFMAAGVMVS